MHQIKLFFLHDDNIRLAMVGKIELTAFSSHEDRPGRFSRNAIRYLICASDDFLSLGSPHFPESVSKSPWIVCQLVRAHTG